jgi:tryptophan-rich sensory protein
LKALGYFLLFLVINFGGLYLGTILMNDGPNTTWYLNLDKAPWTPPGWVFGAAWSFIMLCFSGYLTLLFQWKSSKGLWVLYAFQVCLNVIWNYVFFNQHKTLLGLCIIVALLIVILYYFVTFKADKLKKGRGLLLPYLLWLCIATSLNLYVVIHN